ncbi:MAG: VPLPA-CTERM-specific exosortase XrtD [Desulfobacula sp.]|nr:VPLPA-CTERM-specific exosortase XrtD [Desulfobacula sp.]
MNPMIQLITYAVLLGGTYFSTFTWLVNKDWARDDYSYGILIPFIVLYLLWEKKNDLLSVPARTSWKGYVLLVPGLMLFWLGELAGEFFMLYFSFWLIVFSLCWINMGLDRVKTILFPLLFSLTMFPLPNFINAKITLQLKLLSSKIGVLMMRAYGMSAFREGNVIDLGFTQLQVVDACSGLRYLFPMIVLSILIAYFYHGRLWKKIILVLTSIPLTIFSNSLRIALTGILSESFGSAVIEGFFHDFEGWLIFMITLGALLLEIWILNKVFPEAKEEKKAGPDQFVSLQQATRKRVPGLKTPQFIVSVILLGATLALSQGIEFREAIPMARPFKDFPMQVKGWEGRRQDMESRFIETLNFKDYIMADYKDGSGKIVNFYVAYYESQRKGESIHSPETCLMGGGWQFRQAGSSSLEIGDGKKVSLKRAIIAKEPVRQISYYWYPSRGRVLTSAFEMKWYNFLDALTRQRTDGALVRIITLIYPDETPEQAEDRMKTFIKDFYPVLSEYLPK